MAGRSIRNRNVPVNLIEVRGIASRGENHPLPEKAEDQTLSYPFVETVNEAINSYNNSYVTPSTSGRSSPTLIDHHYESYPSASTGWTTGYSTERSSLFSWTDDEFDKRAARTVRHMFDEIDSTLFEDTKGVSPQLAQECKDWKARFPHLRILGEQLIQPQDAGFQLYPQEAARPSTGSILLDVGDNEMATCVAMDTQELSIQGQHVVATEAPSTEPSQLRTSSPNHQYSHLEEEIFESDGCVEEYLAYDKMGRDDDGFEQKKYHTPRRRRQGFPPITPNACLQDSISCQVFDSLWNEVSTWLRVLIKKHLDKKASEIDSDQRALQPPDVPMLSPLVGLGATFDPLTSPPPSRGYDANRLNPIQSGARLNTAPANTFVDLDGLIIVQAKYLHKRDKAINLPIEGDLSNNRPGSSNLLQRPRTASKIPTKQTKKWPSPWKYPERAKTPMDEFNILAIGKKLKTGSSSPPHPMTSLSPGGGYQWSRSSVLPPIETVHENPQMGTYNLKPLRGFNSRYSHNRVSSAVADDTNRKPFNKIVNPESRPNTTHTFRSETPFGINNRRSSTPQSIPVQYNTSVFRSSNPTAGNTNTFKAGIHGVRVGIGSSFVS
ncbi:protein FAM149A-like isoform X2 [Ptychodera flava]|uniref:protein FAM149A-like isoform X2 n=1 Tax=Ptychodera flava TaxID=63121 RepID=UPI00396A48B9